MRFITVSIQTYQTISVPKNNFSRQISNVYCLNSFEKCVLLCVVLTVITPIILYHSS